MSKLPKRCVVDTNVPIIANRAVDAAGVPEELIDCVLACIEAVEHVVKTGRLVIDSGDEIFDEYRNNLDMKGQPGVGDRFMKWVHDNRWKFPGKDRVTITASGCSYNEFPSHDGLSNFDDSDRKFVAVANAHPAKPPILEATDSKWWGWKEPLTDVGLDVIFLCPDYIEAKYAQKMK
ncbi:MAG: hypothetical protein P4L55_21045 [Syntrophobacteraceae bacterium]|nr:hypothetical protein [Syntrophobacteraceae bacterium]